MKQKYSQIKEALQSLRLITRLKQLPSKTKNIRPAIQQSHTTNHATSTILLKGRVNFVDTPQ